MGMRMFFGSKPGCLSLGTAVDLKFDTQSAQYRREGHGFFILLLIAGHILMPIMIVAAHLTKNRFSKSPILMNFLYANVGYSTSFLLSSVYVNYDGMVLTTRLIGTMLEKMSGLRLKPLSLTGACACRRVSRHKWPPFGNPLYQLEYTLAYLSRQDVYVCIVPYPPST